MITSSYYRRCTSSLPPLSWYHCLFDISMKCFKELNHLKTLCFGFAWLIFDGFSSLDWLVAGPDPGPVQERRQEHVAGRVGRKGDHICLHWWQQPDRSAPQRLCPCLWLEPTAWKATMQKEQTMVHLPNAPIFV